MIGMICVNDWLNIFFGVGKNYFFQNSGTSKTSAIHDLQPADPHAKEEQHLAGRMDLGKLNIGPTLPKPGPALPNVVATAERMDSILICGSS